MILHFLTDEKFSDYVIEYFSAREMYSEFVLITKTKNLVHFHHLDAVRVVNPSSQEDMDHLLKDLSNYNSLIFHGLYAPWAERILRRCPAKIKIAWSVWGSEIYGRPDVSEIFLSPITKAIFKYRKMFKFKNGNEYLVPRELFAKVDYCLTYVDEEYAYCKNYIKTNLKHLRYTYYSLSEMLGPLLNSRSSGNGIFIGNSATTDNNHFDALWRLKKLGVKDRKLVVPLSYGEPWEKNAVIKLGKYLFGNKFTPLVDFIPRDKYNHTMLECSIMIQAHIRERAQGNIVTGLWLGMRVYLSEDSMNYKHFKRIGCYVYSIENDLKRTNPKVLEPLSEGEVSHNRDILLMYYGREHIDAINRLIVNELA